MESKKYTLASRNSALVVLIFLISFGNNASAVTIGLGISDSTPTVGDSFNLNFSISGLSNATGDSLGAFDFDFFYDDTIFTFLSYSFADPALGNQLDLVESSSFGFYGGVDDYGGSLDVYASSGNTQDYLDLNQASNFDFLSLEFSVDAPTESSLFEIDLLDPQLFIGDSGYGDLAFEFSPSFLSVSVSDPSELTPVPIPPTLMTFFSSFIAISAYRFHRKRKSSV